MKKKIYIASPYTQGNTSENIRNHLKAGSTLLEMGHTPFMPLLTHFMDLLHPRSYEEWMEYDMEWLKSCDCVLRLWGASEGADREVKLAESLGKPVFYSIGDLMIFYAQK